MKKELRALLILSIIGALLLGLSVWAWCKPSQESSLMERRKLAAFPKLTLSSVEKGDFMTAFETYALDQFPLRDSFRKVKAWTARYLFGQRDSHGVYLCEGSAAKLDYPLNEKSIGYAAARFAWVYENCLQGTGSKVYLSIIPDKNYFLAEKNGYPALDYEGLTEGMKEQTDFAQYIDLFPLLTAEDYYDTDAHWRQEALKPIAETLLAAMGTEGEEAYIEHTLETPFYGVYRGQSALPMEGDALTYLTGETLAHATVYDYETESHIPVYDLEKGAGRDPYELFLGGSKSLLVLENPQAETEKELLLFRDSFGSSLAPLLLPGYRRITLIDIRYLSPAALDRYVEFHGQDVLFLYSTSVLNNSDTLK